MKDKRKSPLPETIYPVYNTTIGKVIDAGLRIHAYCQACGWNGDLDLEEIARRRGRHQSSLPMHLVPLLVCSQCGGKDIATVLMAGENAPPTEALDEVVRHQRSGDESA